MHAQRRVVSWLHGCRGLTAPAGTAVKPLENLSARYTIDTLGLLFETPPQPMPTPPITPAQRRALAVHLLSAEALSQE